MTQNREIRASASAPVAAPASPAAGRIGRLYLVTTLLAVGASLALQLVALLVPEQGPVLTQIADLLAVFAVAVPSVTSALCGLLLPQALGARGLAFPRLFQLGFGLHAVGVLLLVFAGATYVPKALATGWLLTSVLDAGPSSPAELALLSGVALIAAALVLTSISVLGSVQALRRPGLTWAKLPLSVVGLYAHAVAALLAAPVLVTAVLLAGADRAFGLGLIHGTGDPLPFLHLYWRGLHPLLMVGLAPVIGLALELLAGRSGGVGRPGQHRALLFFSVLACAGYGQHLFGFGLSPVATVLFSLYALLGLAPLMYLVGSAVGRPADWPQRGAGQLLVGLTVVVLLTGYLGLALASGTLPTNLGSDMILFGRWGRDLLVGLVALGFVVAHRRQRLQAAAG